MNDMGELKGYLGIRYLMQYAKSFDENSFFSAKYLVIFFMLYFVLLRYLPTTGKFLGPAISFVSFFKLLNLFKHSNL